MSEPDMLDLRAVIVGGGGFIGRNLSRRLLARGAVVTATGRGERPPELDAAIVWRRVGTVADELPAVVEGNDVVFHVAGSTNPAQSNEHPRRDLASNLGLTLDVLEACRGRIGRLVFASSGGTVYGVTGAAPIDEAHPTDPITAYGINKLACEKYLALHRRLYGLDSMVLRIANPYGALQERGRAQGVVGAMLWSALSDGVARVWGDGATVRDFLHVDDLADAFIAAAAYRGAERLFNVGSGRGRSLSEVAKAVVAAAGGPEKVRVEYTPGRAADVPFNVLDTTLFRRETDWAPCVSWEAGLAATARWTSDQLRLRP